MLVAAGSRSLEWLPVTKAAPRGPAMKLGLALHIGFVRMSGRPLDAFRHLASSR